MGGSKFQCILPIFVLDNVLYCIFFIEKIDATLIFFFAFNFFGFCYMFEQEKTKRELFLELDKNQLWINLCDRYLPYSIFSYEIDYNDRILKLVQTNQNGLGFLNNKKYGLTTENLLSNIFISFGETGDKHIKSLEEILT